MNTISKILGLALIAAAIKTNAQQPAPATTPAGDPPGPAATPASAAPAAAAPAAAAKPKGTAQSEAGEPRANTSRPSSAQAEAGEPRATTSKTPAVAGARPTGGTAQKPPNASDRLELGTATVTGDREQPKVMYIVPWKRSDIGDLAGKPMNSLVDEILAPVDRDVFKREVVYYKAVQAEASQNGAPGRPSEQVEK
jgi:hypothetical protein